MNIKKLIKLINTDVAEPALTIVYLYDRYYFRFHFNGNCSYISARLDKLRVALRSEKTKTKPFGLGMHGNSKYLWFQVDDSKCTFYIAEQNGGLIGDEKPYEFIFSKDFQFKDFLELIDLFSSLEQEQNKFHALYGATNLLS